MQVLFHRVAHQCSRFTTKVYSTSFSSAINLLHADLRQPIFNVYGFVRFADEIVDTFHDQPKQDLLNEFESDTWKAIERRFSLNPILHSFQHTVHQYGIATHLIEAFFYSMQLDLQKRDYDERGYQEYIYGSAEVVGLMCLHIFTEGNQKLYRHLEQSARRLGAAFQKVNFLRDMKADFEGLNRTYFPGCDFNNFSQEEKARIEEDILSDFRAALEGIEQLPLKARFGVYVAYKYYLSLFRKIKRTTPEQIMAARIRIPNYGKAIIVAKAGLRSQLNIL